MNKSRKKIADFNQVRCIAITNNIKELGLDQTIDLEIKEGEKWHGHQYGLHIGNIYEDGNVESAFRIDRENGGNKFFYKALGVLKNNVITKQVLVRRDSASVNCTLCYVPYAVEGHSSTKPTVDMESVDNCMNVSYEIEYEVLFVAEDGLKRYLTISYMTSGPFVVSFFEQIKSLEDILEAYFEENKEGFYTSEGYKTATFYDEVGSNVPIEIESIDELLNMINSLRIINFKSEIKESARTNKRLLQEEN